MAEQDARTKRFIELKKEYSVENARDLVIQEICRDMINRVKNASEAGEGGALDIFIDTFADLDKQWLHWHRETKVVNPEGFRVLAHHYWIAYKDNPFLGAIAKKALEELPSVDEILIVS